MNSYPTAANSSHSTPLVSEAGVRYRQSGAADPFVAWLELMEVVEALCPKWPERKPSFGKVYRL